MRAPSAAAIAAAQSAQRKYGILASTSLAQWALESDWGAKTTGLNNYFGVKAPSLATPGRLCWTHEVERGEAAAVQCRFRDFADTAAAFDYHALLIATDKRYARAYALRAELGPYVRALAPVYATDPHYADSLLGLISANRLAAFDLGAPRPLPPAGAADAHPVEVDL